MKKYLFCLCAVAGLLSCTKEMTPREEAPAGVPMTFEINVAGTKAAKTDWAAGDVVYVFFNGIQGKYLTLTCEADGTWTNSTVGELTDEDFAGLGALTLTAVHFPVAVDVTYDDGQFSFTSDDKPVYSYYLFETDNNYTVAGTTVTTSISLGKPADMVLIHVADIQDNVADYTFGCSKIRPVACMSVGDDGLVNESVLQPGARLSGFADEDGAVFAGRLVNPEAKFYSFTLSYMDPTPANDKIYSLERDPALTAGKMYNFPAPSNSRWTATPASDLYVDLGLPSGTKWATCNLGASREWLYGDYFAWGETTGYMAGKRSFTWSNYFDTSDGGETFHKYALDKKTLIEPADDAAYAALGGRFRMPTYEEWEELWKSNYCSWVWYAMDHGYRVTSKMSGYTDKSIFLPAAGKMVDKELYNQGTAGNYWNASLDGSDSDQSRFVSFSSETIYRAGDYRYRGQSIRPVYAE